MLFRLSAIVLLSAVATSIAAALPHCAHGSKHQATSPCKDAYIVDAACSLPNSYSTIGDAVNALVSANATDTQTLFLMPGTYDEQVYIPQLAGPLTVQGFTCDTRSYEYNQVTITGNLSRQVPNISNNDQTSTVRLWTSNVKLYNLNIENTFGSAPTDGQALALSAQNTDQGFYACQFKAYQDTIYANAGRQLYAHSYISGAVDFIFGLNARAWFEQCDIETVGEGYITANGRDAANNTSFYVFNKANVNGTSGPASTYLGRPWRDYSRVVWQRSYLGDVVSPAGWSEWDGSNATENVYYREYKNHGSGSVGPRVSWSGQLRKELRIEEILGEGFEKEEWVDGSYL